MNDFHPATETTPTEMAPSDTMPTETTPADANPTETAGSADMSSTPDTAAAPAATGSEPQPLPVETPSEEPSPEQPEIASELAPETAEAAAEPEPVTIDAEATVEAEPVGEPEGVALELEPEPEPEAAYIEVEPSAIEAEAMTGEAGAVAAGPVPVAVEAEVAAAEPAPEPEPGDITQLTALEIARRVRARQISPVAVIEAHLAAIERTNPAVNAVCTLAADHALEAARRLEADLAAGREVGPLAGVPVGIKDLTATAGIRTTYASTLYADNVPTEDALVVQRLKAAGCIVIGKTNTSEFGAGANTFNAVFGATRNPWNTALSASGSTGGGAAGLRSGMFALAEGSDFGGSLRTPAAFCGVVGLRPSPGLVPRYPSTTPWDILSVTGPMARSVPDLAAMLQVMSGPSPYSPLMVPVAGRDFLAAARAGIKPGLRIAYCADAPKIGVDNELEQICRAAAFALRDAGAAVEEIDLDLSVGRSAFLQLRAQAQLSRHLHHLGKLDKLGQNLAGNIRLGLAQSPRDIALGEHGQAQIFHAFRRLFENYDCLLTPCTAVPPFPVERNYPETINGQAMKSYIEWVAPTFVVTLAGLPALSVPCGFTAANLPVGLQIVGPRWGEELTLGVGKAVEDRYPVGFPSVS